VQQQRQAICLVAAGLSQHTVRLQPWRYLHETARQLIACGHRVTIISDGAGSSGAPECLEGVPVRRIVDVRSFAWRTNQQLQQALAEQQPDQIIWNLGLTSFLHQRIEGPRGVPVVGVLTSPIYRAHELARLGPARLARGYQLSGAHVVGTLLPRGLMRRALAHGTPTRLVVQTRATRQRLIEDGVAAEQVSLIAPGIDSAWGSYQRDEHVAVREQLGYVTDDTVVLYFGSPAPLRGLHTLIRALEVARRQEPSLKLMVLNRRRADELLRADADLRELLAGEIGAHVRVVSGFLDEGPLVAHVAASDIVALPFELVPSDAPLSLLEAKALGKPVVTSDLGCLPELLEGGAGYLARPADVGSLAQALVDAARDLQRRPDPPPARPARGWQQMGEEWSCLLQTI
jgi:glycosyltransferase involved in cell wall biosynthesis